MAEPIMSQQDKKVQLYRETDPTAHVLSYLNKHT